ncbi:hypothetical protein [Mycoplasmopsis columbinasalis]|uniref:Uncharacterized protein n=1 Tax=Mycoplasmopsis columbinasalis TaxID=114880 RepID=A0A449BAZ0_9BACT|nr:hypothetical protein [Mycoplasmopsis columbinasalis]VEU78359.1 Uncharacterised protein [Mycoplasmopsis columbinasalis]
MIKAWRLHPVALSYLPQAYRYRGYFDKYNATFSESTHIFITDSVGDVTNDQTVEINGQFYISNYSPDKFLEILGHKSDALTTDNLANLDLGNITAWSWLNNNGNDLIATIANGNNLLLLSDGRARAYNEPYVVGNYNLMPAFSYSIDQLYNLVVHARSVEDNLKNALNVFENADTSQFFVDNKTKLDPSSFAAFKDKANDLISYFSGDYLLDPAALATKTFAAQNALQSFLYYKFWGAPDANNDMATDDTYVWVPQSETMEATSWQLLKNQNSLKRNFAQFLKHDFANDTTLANNPTLKAQLQALQAKLSVLVQMDAFDETVPTTIGNMSALDAKTKLWQQITNKAIKQLYGWMVNSNFSDALAQGINTNPNLLDTIATSANLTIGGAAGDFNNPAARSYFAASQLQKQLKTFLHFFFATTQNVAAAQPVLAPLFTNGVTDPAGYEYTMQHLESSLTNLFMRRFVKLDDNNNYTVLNANSRLTYDQALSAFFAIDPNFNQTEEQAAEKDARFLEALKALNLPNLVPGWLDNPNFTKFTPYQDLNGKLTVNMAAARAFMAKWVSTYVLPMFLAYNTVQQNGYLDVSLNFINGLNYSNNGTFANNFAAGKAIEQYITNVLGNRSALNQYFVNWKETLVEFKHLNAAYFEAKIQSQLIDKVDPIINALHDNAQAITTNYSAQGLTSAQLPAFNSKRVFSDNNVDGFDKAEATGENGYFTRIGVTLSDQATGRDLYRQFYDDANQWKTPTSGEVIINRFHYFNYLLDKFGITANNFDDIFASVTAVTSATELSDGTFKTFTLAHDAQQKPMYMQVLEALFGRDTTLHNDANLLAYVQEVITNYGFTAGVKGGNAESVYLGWRLVNAMFDINSIKPYDFATLKAEQAHRITFAFARMLHMALKVNEDYFRYTKEIAQNFVKKAIISSEAVPNKSYLEVLDLLLSSNADQSAALNGNVTLGETNSPLPAALAYDYRVLAQLYSQVADQETSNAPIANPAQFFGGTADFSSSTAPVQPSTNTPGATPESVAQVKSWKSLLSTLYARLNVYQANLYLQNVFPMGANKSGIGENPNPTPNSGNEHRDLNGYYTDVLYSQNYSSNQEALEHRGKTAYSALFAPGTNYTPITGENNQPNRNNYWWAVDSYGFSFKAGAPVTNATTNSPIQGTTDLYWTPTDAYIPNLVFAQPALTNFASNVALEDLSWYTGGYASLYFDFSNVLSSRNTMDGKFKEPATNDSSPRYVHTQTILNNPVFLSFATDERSDTIKNPLTNINDDAGSQVDLHALLLNGEQSAVPNYLDELATAKTDNNYAINLGYLNVAYDFFWRRFLEYFSTASDATFRANLKYGEAWTRVYETLASANALTAFKNFVLANDLKTINAKWLQEKVLYGTYALLVDGGFQHAMLKGKSLNKAIDAVKELMNINHQSDYMNTNFKTRMEMISEVLSKIKDLWRNFEELTSSLRSAFKVAYRANVERLKTLRTTLYNVEVWNDAGNKTYTPLNPYISAFTKTKVVNDKKVLAAFPHDAFLNNIASDVVGTDAVDNVPNANTSVKSSLKFIMDLFAGFAHGFGTLKRALVPTNITVTNGLINFDVENQGFVWNALAPNSGDQEALDGATAPHNLSTFAPFYMLTQLFNLESPLQNRKNVANGFGQFNAQDIVNFIKYFSYTGNYNFQDTGAYLETPTNVFENEKFTAHILKDFRNRAQIFLNLMNIDPIYGQSATVKNSLNASTDLFRKDLTLTDLSQFYSYLREFAAEQFNVAFLQDNAAAKNALATILATGDNNAPSVVTPTSTAADTTANSMLAANKVAPGVTNTNFTSYLENVRTSLSTNNVLEDTSEFDLNLISGAGSISDTSNTKFHWLNVTDDKKFKDLFTFFYGLKQTPEKSEYNWSANGTNITAGELNLANTRIKILVKSKNSKLEWWKYGSSSTDEGEKFQNATEVKTIITKLRIEKLVGNQWVTSQISPNVLIKPHQSMINLTKLFSNLTSRVTSANSAQVLFNLNNDYDNINWTSLESRTNYANYAIKSIYDRLNLSSQDEGDAGVYANTTFNASVDPYFKSSNGTVGWKTFMPKYHNNFFKMDGERIIQGNYKVGANGKSFSSLYLDYDNQIVKLAHNAAENELSVVVTVPLTFHTFPVWPTAVSNNSLTKVLAQNGRPAASNDHWTLLMYDQPNSALARSSTYTTNTSNLYEAAELNSTPTLDKGSTWDTYVSKYASMMGPLASRVSDTVKLVYVNSVHL